MRRLRQKLGFLAVLGFGIALSASGQGRGTSVPMHAPSAPLRSFSVPRRGGSAPAVRGFSGQVRTTSRPFRASGFRRGSSFSPVIATPLNPSFLPINGVPGLGFDFPHLAAVSRGFPQQFVVLNNGFSPFFTPVFFDPFAFSEAGVISDEEQRQPIFVVPQPPQQPPSQPSNPPAEAAPRPSAAPQAPPAPPPELGQLILVRGDGQVLLAVAFTVRNGQLTYITNEGTRRSFPASELDKEATRQMNDANGTTVSLPN
jgi:hypothetical protein